MDQGAVSRKKFYVRCEGKTNGAHQSFVEKLKRAGTTKVSTPEESDYQLVFCPVASRVGTDIHECLNKIPAGKPAILVVMHHTFNPEHAVAESRRQVNKPNVHLTVDCLFHEGKLLECNRNDIALFEVRKFLGVSAFQVPFCMRCYNWVRNNPEFAVSVVCGGLGLMVLIGAFVALYFAEVKKN